MDKPPDETLKQGRNRSWLLVKSTNLCHGLVLPHVFESFLKLFSQNLYRDFVERKLLYKMYCVWVPRRWLSYWKKELQWKKLGFKNAEFFWKRNFYDMKTQSFRILWVAFCSVFDVLSNETLPNLNEQKMTEI